MVKGFNPDIRILKACELLATYSCLNTSLLDHFCSFRPQFETFHGSFSLKITWLSTSREFMALLKLSSRFNNTIS